MKRALFGLGPAAMLLVAFAACEDSASSSGATFDGGAPDGTFTAPDGSALDGSVDGAQPVDGALADAATVPQPPKTNLEVWVRADLGVTLTAGKVSAWNDQSGKNHHFTQPNAMLQPTLTKNDAGAGAALEFLGVEHLVSDGTQLFPTADAPLTVAVVFTSTDPSVQRFLFNYGNGGGGNMNYELGYATGNQAAGNFGLHRGASNGTTTAGGHIQIGTVYRAVVSLAAAGATPANVSVRTNGAEQALANGGAGFLSAGAYVTATAPMEIGGRVDGNFVALDLAAHLAAQGDAHHIGSISEVLVYKGGLAAGDLPALEAYLATR